VSKKDPLEHDALIVTSGGEAEETFGVVLADKVKKDGSTLKDDKGLWLMLTVDEDRDATVGVQSNEPRFLLTVGGDVDFLDFVIYDVAVCGSELFEQDGYFESIGGGRGIE